MDIESFISGWIAQSNAFDTDKYLDNYREDVILNDPSVGRKFIGREGIRDYFTSYFIGYQTQTRLVKLDAGLDQAHLEVEFTGTFPEGKIGGTFEIFFEEEKITSLKADLT